MSSPGSGPDRPDGLVPEQAPADEAPPVEPLGRSAAAGTLWLTAAQWVMRLTGLITVAILTRLLTPEDFGVVAAAMTVTPFLLLLADLGLSTYVIQVKHADQRLLSTAFWYSLSMAIALMAAIAVFAPVIAALFNLPGAAPVLRGCSLAAGFIVLCSVPAALLRREMKFRLLSLQWLFSAVIAQVVAIVLAVRGAGAWALVSQLVVAEAISCVLCWKAAHWRPRFQFSKPEFFAMAKFGNKVVTVDLIVAMRPAAEAAIISTVLGPAALGYLSIAQRLVQVMQDLGGKALVPVSTVVFAKVRESPERLQTAYVKALSIAYAAVSPLMTVVVVGGTLVVPLLFGQGWDESVPVAQALGLAAILTLGAIIDQRLFYGTGKPGRWLAYAACFGALEIAVTALVAHKGLNWVAIGFVFVALVATVVRWLLVGRLLGIRPRRLAAVFAAACAAVAGSAGAGLLALNLTAGWAQLWSLAAVIPAIGVVHLAIVRVVSPEVYRTVLALVPRPRSADEST
ncbi:lipopolysaccharide biosynthesis protein [Mycolicibacterium diernhoferi]|uniref:Polysaccharide biosynthesis protein n=1 Tax=Mycolicibacterium diernhoferi TaxID=1801 RepID=A0A1Q4HDC9_9MYCO|nr:lipopolysaccharide biosynthesis protein [Mycolicibacterium diernhoferi]OJZ65546.1 polysaccharide biosynthesis protein [Mycolicibacterium diernhoferi]OPE56265.1 polysaccharide biosynthesis protein [Mycolicibacterium diernhoferi]PEG55922.1 lipopolysaccharide biosynthesis protein [Mycolicibacterium diernhoferi]QYL22286.1 lipopolysaccharide biosynthesis protein [Mycolicibacterium diernhoferi]